MLTIIGIDPGKSGAIAFMYPNGSTVAHKMPDTEKDLYDLISSEKLDGQCFAYIENVHSSPQMGVKSAFTFGENKGMLRMVLTATSTPYDQIRPQKWQKALSCMSKGDKNVTKRRAQELFPDIKITHAIADALLIAEYGRRIKAGELVA